MDEKRMVIIGVGAVLVVSTITLLAVTMSATSDEAQPATQMNRSNPLLLISLDGFRSDYIFRYVPTLASLAENGVKARFMMPSYPTVTFTNHYTIVTGLYPESHGIVANHFYDPEFNETFGMEIKEGKWWGGEPIWNTLTDQNKTSATYFWPGSDADINDQYPTEWYPFDQLVPFEDRVDKVVEWLSRSENRPDWVSLYFNEPDSTGHEYGPDTSEVDNILNRVDGMISRLLSGLRRNKMENKVNIIVLADHGMAEAGPEKAVNLTDYVPDILDATKDISYGAFTMLKLKNQSEEAVGNMLKQLSCPKGAPYIRAFKSQDLPTRFHYSNNPRIGDIVVDFGSGYYTIYPNGATENGEHGYDNHLSTMSALFIATGPDFQKGVTLEPFQNIEIYNLMCHLIGVEPAPNNGTIGSLNAALLDPPPIPELPVEDPLPAPKFPDNLSNATLWMANCNNLTESEMQLKAININEAEQEKLITEHLPWGIPLSGNLSANVTLLHHKDHVTGFSQTLKMPLWTSFTVSSTPLGTERSDSLWISDVRLNEATTPTCDLYKSTNVSMFPLFPPEFSVNDTLNRIPYLVSNAVPLYTGALTLQYVANTLAPSMMTEHTPYNMIIGPVFDNDADSFPDNFDNFTTLEVPSDIFVVITRCRLHVASLNECQHENLDAIALILPEYKTVSTVTCMEENGNLFLSTVHDVELATGLTFFNIVEPSSRLQLSLKIHRDFWNVIA